MPESGLSNFRALLQKSGTMTTTLIQYYYLDAANDAIKFALKV